MSQELNQIINLINPEFNKNQAYKNISVELERIAICKKESKLTMFGYSNVSIPPEYVADIKRLFEYELDPLKVEVSILPEEYKWIPTTWSTEDLVQHLRGLVPVCTEWLLEEHIELFDSSVVITCPSRSLAQSFQMSSGYKKFKSACRSLKNLEIEIRNNGDDSDRSFLTVKADEEKLMIKDISNNAIIRDEKQNLKLLHGEKFTPKFEAIIDLLDFEGECMIKARLFGFDIKQLKNKKHLGLYKLTDDTYSILGKIFGSEKSLKEISHQMGKEYCYIHGVISYDIYEKARTITIKNIMKEAVETVIDDAEMTRVELHAHSKMSAMDGVVDVKDLLKYAMEINHDAMAITDTSVVQAFPDAMQYVEKNNPEFKMIYGVEAYMIEDMPTNGHIELDVKQSYVVFDIETTGLSAQFDKIIEIGAVKIRDSQIVDRFSTFVNPEMGISQEIINLTGINDDMVSNAPKINTAIKDFLQFTEDAILVAHNSDFDMGFIRVACRTFGLTLKNEVIDTLDMARRLYPKLKKHRLGSVCKFLGIDLRHAHRAVYDAEATGEAFIRMIKEIHDRDCNTLQDFYNLTREFAVNGRGTQITILTETQEGLKNLYKLISISHMDEFHKRPKMLRSTICKYRHGLIIGSGSSAGALYEGILSCLSYEELINLAKFYDYLEVQPEEQNCRLLSEHLVQDFEALRDINRLIVGFGEELGIPVVATGDVFIIDPHERQYRDILRHAERHKLGRWDEAHYFRTTKDMLSNFEYLGKEKAYEIVVTNTRTIADRIQHIRPIPKGTFVPKMESAESELKKMTLTKAYELYGNPLPDYVKERIDLELHSIISNGYAVLYVIAQKIVLKSNEDGYMVGSRGSVGSSLVATLMGITEVNPLAPHYRCPNCQFSEFFLNAEYQSGLDLEDKRCPHCKTDLIKDGHDIPFEVFLGFEGDKEPDIDLNFASEYQSIAHRYTESIFGQDHVYRAGTITTIADQTAIGYVLKFLEDHDEQAHPIEIERLAKGCTGVKRSSGQHPGGVMIVPEDFDIFDFSPIQYPADDPSAGVITTHFDYNAISGTILKLDLLGHDAPMAIKMLEDMTGTNAKKIRTDDADVMSLFNHPKALNLSEDIFKVNTGTLGIPEFGTAFVRQMLLETKPKRFSDLVRISGLSHGTNVWRDNADKLISSKKAVISEVVATREDVMLKLIAAGLDKKQAFTIMERVRKGKGLLPEHSEAIETLHVEPWYIESCEKIKYLFPKAHAVAYVLMSFRIAYYKLNYPTAFYATSFTIDVDHFDGSIILKGAGAIKDKIKEIRAEEKKITAKNEKIIEVFELALEMYARGIEFLPVDLYRSEAIKFTIEENKIRPPFRSLVGVGENAAFAIVKERQKQEFNSIEDMVERTKINKSVISALKEQGCLNGLSEKNQLSFFGFSEH